MWSLYLSSISPLYLLFLNIRLIIGNMVVVMSIPQCTIFSIPFNMLHIISNPSSSASSNISPCAVRQSMTVIHVLNVLLDIHGQAMKETAPCFNFNSTCRKLHIYTIKLSSFHNNLRTFKVVYRRSYHWVFHSTLTLP